MIRLWIFCLDESVAKRFHRWIRGRISSCVIHPCRHVLSPRVRRSRGEVSIGESAEGPFRVLSVPEWRVMVIIYCTWSFKKGLLVSLHLVLSLGFGQSVIVSAFRSLFSFSLVQVGAGLLIWKQPKIRRKWTSRRTNTAQNENNLGLKKGMSWKFVWRKEANIKQGDGKIEHEQNHGFCRGWCRKKKQRWSLEREDKENHEES